MRPDTHRRPFQGEHDTQLMMTIVLGRYEPRSAIARDYPHELSIIVIRGLAKRRGRPLPDRRLSIHPFSSSSAARNAAIASAAERSLARPREMVMVPGGPPEDLPV